MIWALYFDYYRLTLEVHPYSDTLPDSHAILVSQRDPDQPMVFKQGGVYFNPLFKKGGALHPYVVNGDGALVSVFNGRAPRKILRAQRAQYDRGWFELPPRALDKDDIHPDLQSLLRHQPKLLGAITQVALSKMGMRIPAGLSIDNYDDWLTWFTSQRTPMPPRIKTVLYLLQNRPSALVFSEFDYHRLFTGQEPEKTYSVRLRWYRQETVKIVRKQLLESGEWQLEVPQSVLDGGQDALIAFANQKYGENWKTLMTEFTGVTDLDVESVPDDVVEGPLIWVRENGSQKFGLLNARPTEGPTINDLFQMALTS